MRKARNIFFGLFILSGLIAAYSLMQDGRGLTGDLDGYPDPILLLSLITSLISLTGSVATAILAWRKDRREAVIGNLDLELKAIELEQKRLELEQQRRGIEAEHAEEEHR